MLRWPCRNHVYVLTCRLFCKAYSLKQEKKTKTSSSPWHENPFFLNFNVGCIFCTVQKSRWGSRGCWRGHRSAGCCRDVTASITRGTVSYPSTEPNALFCHRFSPNPLQFCSPNAFPMLHTLIYLKYIPITYCYRPWQSLLF